MRYALLLGLWLIAAPLAHAAEYDPLAVQAAEPIKSFDLSVTAAARKREIPLRIYLPADKAAAPVVLFSHGLGGTRAGNKFLGEHWAARGYVAVFLQHPGSDASVWKTERPAQRLAAMKAAASAENFLLRVQDVPAVLDQLAVWNKQADHDLHGRLDLERIGMSGHSFGAVTTQAVCGQTMALGGQRLTDKRLRAAVIFSPGSPRRGKPEDAFGAVRIPWLLMTGTKDTSPISDQDVESRLAVYKHLPPGDKYELVLDKAEHSAFTDRPLPGDTEPRNPNHHRVILALSTAFWDAYLREDPAARDWLQSDRPAALLEKADRWQRK
jgi:predicted dienelactone hydrolase